MRVICGRELVFREPGLLELISLNQGASEGWTYNRKCKKNETAEPKKRNMTTLAALNVNASSSEQ